MERFHAPPDRILWYYESNLGLAERRGVPDALLVPLRDTVAQLRECSPAGEAGTSAERELRPLESTAPDVGAVDEAHDMLRSDGAERPEGQVLVAPLGTVDA